MNGGAWKAYTKPVAAGRNRQDKSVYTWEVCAPDGEPEPGASGRCPDEAGAIQRAHAWLRQNLETWIVRGPASEVRAVLRRDGVAHRFQVTSIDGRVEVTGRRIELRWLRDTGLIGVPDRPVGRTGGPYPAAPRLARPIE